MRVADIDQEQQDQERHEHQPQPQAGGEKDDDRGQRGEFVRAGLDEDDGAGGADRPQQRALQRCDRRRSRQRGKRVIGRCRIRHHTLYNATLRNKSGATRRHKTQYAFSFRVSSAIGVLSRM